MDIPMAGGEGMDIAQNSVLIIDCGGGDARQIARGVRGAGVYCEIIDAKRGFEGFAGRNPAGLIAVGGDDSTGGFPPILLAPGVPILALGGAARSLLQAVGGGVGEPAVQNTLCYVRIPDGSELFEQVESGMRMIGCASLLTLPEGFEIIAADGDIPLAFSDRTRGIFGLQFHLERNDVDGYRILSNFVKNICGCDGTWSLKTYLDTAVEGIRNRVGDGCAICPMTGGVDSAVCAALASRALGERAKCVLVDTGLMTDGEGDGIERAFAQQMEVPLLRVPAAARFLNRLRGAADPEQKRRIVAEEYSAVLTEQGAGLEGRDVFLIRGTIYDDVLEEQSAFASGIPAHWIVLEPLRGLFKREVRELGNMLGLPQSIAERQPFPSAGLAVRCLGEASAERVSVLRNADAIFKRTLEEAGAHKGLSQYFAILPDARALDNEGGRSGHTVVLRAVSRRETGRVHAARLSYDLLESATEAILREVPSVKRVLYDLTPLPPAAIEWE